MDNGMGKSEPMGLYEQETTAVNDPSVVSAPVRDVPVSSLASRANQSPVRSQPIDVNPELPKQLPTKLPLVSPYKPINELFEADSVSEDTSNDYTTFIVLGGLLLIYTLFIKGGK